MNDGTLTISSVAEMLNVHSDTVRKWCERGLIPFERTPGGHRRFKRADVEAFKQPQPPVEPTTTLDDIAKLLRRVLWQLGDRNAWNPNL